MNYKKSMIDESLVWTNPNRPYKSVNLQFNTVGRRDDDMTVRPFHGPMIIWIDWE